MNKKPSRLTKNLIDMGKDLKDLGLIDEDAYEKITVRLLKKEKKNFKMEPITSDEIRAIRERAYKPSSFCNISKLNRRLYLTARARIKAPDGGSPRIATESMV